MRRRSRWGSHYKSTLNQAITPRGRNNLMSSNYWVSSIPDWSLVNLQRGVTPTSEMWQVNKTIINIPKDQYLLMTDMKS